MRRYTLLRARGCTTNPWSGLAEVPVDAGPYSGQSKRSPWDSAHDPGTCLGWQGFGPPPRRRLSRWTEVRLTFIVLGRGPEERQSSPAQELL